VLDDSRAPFYGWSTGGRLNSCHNALDRHVERGRGEQLALIYDSPVTANVKLFTYHELLDAVARFAGRSRPRASSPAIESSCTCLWCPRP
jgi:propionyl-CoA synthetase